MKLTDEKFLEMQAAVQNGKMVYFQGRSASSLPELEKIVRFAQQEEEAANEAAAEAQAKKQAAQLAIEREEAINHALKATYPKTGTIQSEPAALIPGGEDTGNEGEDNEPLGREIDPDAVSDDANTPPVSEKPVSPLAMHSVAVLREMANGYGITGLASKNKPQLIEAIEAAQSMAGDAE